MMSNELRARAWVEIDTAALRENYQAVAARSGMRSAIIPMVKANAYGLGAELAVRMFAPLNPYAFGVAAAEEGAALRRAGVSGRILVFTPLTFDGLRLAAANKLTPAISSIEQLEQWTSLAAGGFHIEVDTGMGRAGFDWRETAQWAPHVRRLAADTAPWEGIYTHFHGADAADATSAVTQWQRFQGSLDQLPVSRENLLVHASNSAAAMRWPEYALDAVRPGIYLYGGNPAPGISAVQPRPVAGIKARVVLVREVPPGSTVGYGATHVAKAWERWATISIGYGDGLRRELGNTGSAIVRGRRVKIIGRISMDMTVVDVSGLAEIETGDIATFVGAEGEEEILVDEVAAHCGTISYEILTGLTPRLFRLES